MDLALIGLCSAVVTEVLKVVPFLRKSQVTVSIVAIIVTALGTWVYNPNGLSFDALMAALASALVSYKMVIQPLATGMKLPTQKKA